MKQIKRLKLSGEDGNAFAIMSRFRRQARNEGWSDQEINEVLKEAKSKDYEHLLGTIMEHVKKVL